MRRRTFDSILTAVGFLMAIALLVAGGLLMWGYSFANSNVHKQLAAQQIYFPAKGSSDLANPQIGPYLNQYAGQQLTNGAQAQAYANHYIAVHLKEIAGGQTYSQVSAASQKDPTNLKLAAQAQTLFRGETLRGLLLNAYAFWKLGQIALWSGIASFILAAIMLVLSVLGLVHLRRVPPEQEVFGGPRRSPEPAKA